MEDFFNETEAEDTLNIAAKDWNRVIENARKDGYREGRESGADTVFQEGFDRGYQEAFQTAFILGKFKSLLSLKDINPPEHIRDILDKTRRGACYLCKVEAQDGSSNEKSFSQVIEEQRIHSLNTIKILYEYFQPYVNELNIEEADIAEIEHQIKELSVDK